MPQARRKTPFSGKAKKQQLQSKKNKNFVTSSSSGTSSGLDSVMMPVTRRSEQGRFALRFYRESDEELLQKKQDASREVTRLPETALEVESMDYFPDELAFPKRPPWSYDMTKAQLETQEQKYFTEYVSGLQRSPLWNQISYFELNLETWRQLWRVLEISDILLFIVDIRYPAMMFPISLYRHVVETCGKSMVLILNKVDLVKPGLVAAWKSHLTERYPALKVLYFTSCPGYNLRTNTEDKAGLQIRRRKGRQRMAVEGATKLAETCREIVGEQVDLTSWMEKISEDSLMPLDEDDKVEIGETLVQKPDTTYYEHVLYKNGILTIGCVGQPNVGKSSLINSLMGRKVVSVSSTPGHTKHLQTIFITPQVRLCDCPGLVFPSLVPRTLQILMGSYPIAQLREPYSAIRYLSERLDLPSLLRIQHPDGDTSWSPRDICDGWAKRRGYYTAKAARLDTYRAANAILRMALDGKLCLALAPPGYTKDKEYWELSPEVQYVRYVQALSEAEPGTEPGPGSASDSEEESEERESSGDEGAPSNKFAALLKADDCDDDE